MGWIENRRKIFLHHFVFGKPKDGFVIDHINGNGLDNQKSNLRFATKSQNNQNIDKPRKNKYIGIYASSVNRWGALCKGVIIGYFDYWIF